VAAIQNLFDLHDRTAVVTGGAGLLGEPFCHTLAQAGANVVVADKNGDAARRIAGSLIKQGYPALAIDTDVTDPQSVHSMVSTTLDSFGHLDILINSAALDPKFDHRISTQASFSNLSSQPEKVHPPGGPELVSGAFESFPLEAWNEALAVNLTGVFLTSQAAVQPMLAQGGGVIVNLCSIYGLVGPDQQIYQRNGMQPQYKPVYYSVTKAGILGFTRYLAAYYAGKAIRVNALTPGGVFNQHDDEFLQAYSARTILGRMAQKDEMNGALLFLVSDASSYMTGANLVVDGGWTAW
jgi:NAD(P)-dependent dehydrogenase (short-subunit alcohol dehydrogenase family)